MPQAFMPLLPALSCRRECYPILFWCPFSPVGPWYMRLVQRNRCGGSLRSRSKSRWACVCFLLASLRLSDRPWYLHGLARRLLRCESHSTSYVSRGFSRPSRCLVWFCTGFRETHSWIISGRACESFAYSRSSCLLASPVSTECWEDWPSRNLPVWCS